MRPDVTLNRLARHLLSVRGRSIKNREQKGGIGIRRQRRPEGVAFACRACRKGAPHGYGCAIGARPLRTLNRRVSRPDYGFAPERPSCTRAAPLGPLTR